jgi:predicted DNA-binding protein
VTQNDDDTTNETTSEASEERAARKERVLHTRVPAVLEDELKKLATNLKMPVSNVVRAILEDALEAVEVVGSRAEDELKGFTHRLSEQRDALRRGATQAVRDASATAERATTEARGKRAPAKPVAVPVSACPDAAPELDDVIGFQRLTLRAEAVCTVCGLELPKGTEACRGVRDDGGPRVMLGPNCKLSVIE